MKLAIKVKEITKGCLPQITEDGEWIDLRAAKDINLGGPYSTVRSRKGGQETRKVVNTTEYIPLGVAMELPKGFEANIVLRSSANKNFNIMQTNSFGVIDISYSGDEDEWKLPVITTGECSINALDRVCQFRIQLSQKATVWQKIKWLLSSGVEIKVVESLGNPNRGGLGHSGVK